MFFQWSVVSGQWSVVDDQWSVVDDQWSVVGVNDRWSLSVVADSLIGLLTLFDICFI